MEAVATQNNDLKEHLTTESVLAAIESISDSHSVRVGKFSRWIRQKGYSFDSPHAVISTSKAFIAELENQGWSDKNGRSRDYTPQGINGYIFAIRNRIKRLIEHSPGLSQGERYMLETEVKTLRPYKLNTTAVASEKFLSLDEIRRFIAEAPIRESLIVEFLFATGLRISEAIGIKHASIKHLQDGAKIQIRGKGKKGRELYCTKELIDRIRREYAGSTYLFETRRSYRNGQNGGQPYRREYIYQRLRDLGVQILGRKVTPHMLRHSFIDSTIRKFDLEAVSQYVGHSNVSTTVNQYLSRTLKPEDIMEHIRGLG